jgi:glutamate/tyrosine decarboxylase-like PLP-dependent enzyme
MKPVVFVSAAAHYSVRKAANALGYGERAVKRIPVDRRFRIDIGALKNAIFELPRERYVAAVVGIVGTTEEGAVDRINAIKELRDELEHQRNASFWLHVDAAWGGYVSALFRGHKIKHESKGLTDLCKAYAAVIKARERTAAAPYDPEDEHRKRGKKRYPFSKSMKQAPVAWDDPDVYGAYLAMADADSITVDPHKLGYVPYPAGMVSFRHGVVTDHVRQRAHYIHGGSKAGAAQILDEPGPVKNVGPYILEGSKPGAAATACWLAHKTIPLDIGGHGKIVKTSLLNAQRLARYLREHRHVFREVDKKVFF